LNVRLAIATRIAMLKLQIFAHGTARLGIVEWIKHDTVEFATRQALVVEVEIPAFEHGCRTFVAETTKLFIVVSSGNMTTKAQRSD
jgi:hypothetical protein